MIQLRFLMNDNDVPKNYRYTTKFVFSYSQSQLVQDGFKSTYSDTKIQDFLIIFFYLMSPF